PIAVSQIDILQLTIAVINANSIRLKWQSLPGDSLYSIYSALDAAGPFHFIQISDTTQAIIDIEDDTRRCFQVRRILTQ
ncbi:hypothetical protein KKB28_10475, partial [bacterium]|nr:hypothetical protein [bacterium]